LGRLLGWVVVVWGCWNTTPWWSGSRRWVLFWAYKFFYFCRRREVSTLRRVMRSNSSKTRWWITWSSLRVRGGMIGPGLSTAHGTMDRLYY
jgi:hypothetical protein